MFGNGLDKKSINYKVKCVDDNQDYILNFRSNDIINKADNKTCFISSCLEYERFIEFMNDLDKTLFNSYLPIQLDASCNGYQHLALLTKETKLFDKLNLDESTFDDTPKDFYKYIIEKTNKYVNNQIDILSNTVNLNETVSKLLSRLKVIEKIKFDRSIVKNHDDKVLQRFYYKTSR